MKKGQIFLVEPNQQTLVPMQEEPYEQEVILQDYLVTYPDLLPGDQIDPNNPRRWLLVKREIGIPAMVGGGNVWSLDHLFLDQDGIPTFVECKRMSDTRIRREVVAQMLDYAANGTAYWSVDQLRRAATETVERQGNSLDETLYDLLEDDTDEANETFWGQVEENLREGNVRLLFVADETPRELRRLVEFLNEKMTGVELLIVEIKQFKGQAQTALVPRVIGQSEATKARKSTQRQPRLTLEEIKANSTPIAAKLFNKMILLANEKGLVVRPGRKGFSIRYHQAEFNRFNSFVFGYPPNVFEFYLRDIPAIHEPTLRQALMAYDLLLKSGNHTLRGQVTEENLETAVKVYKFMLEQLESYGQIEGKENHKPND